jgi:hypothetical protein
METLVAVGLGKRDVVAEAPGHRPPGHVGNAEGLVALALAVDQDAECDDVIDFVVLELLLDHLLADRVGALGAAGDLGFDACGLQALGQDRGDLFDVAFALQPLERKLLAHLFVGRRLQGAETGFLELALEPVDAEAVGQGRVEIERLGGDATALVRRQVIEGAQVVGPIGQLDHQHADVGGAGDEHLAQGIGLRLFAGIGLDAVDLGDTVHQRRHLAAEALGHVVQGRARVLDGVVQQSGDNGRNIQPHLGDDPCDGQRMGDVGLAGLAALALVVLFGEVVGALHHADVCGGVVVANAFDQIG